MGPLTPAPISEAKLCCDEMIQTLLCKVRPMSPPPCLSESDPALWNKACIIPEVKALPGNAGPLSAQQEAGACTRHLSSKWDEDESGACFCAGTDATTSSHTGARRCTMAGKGSC